MAERDITIRFTGDPKQLSAALRQVHGALGDVEQQTESLGTRMQASGKRMADTGDNLTRRVSLPLLAIGGAALKVGSNFDDAMSQIVGLVGLSADEVDGMRESVLKLSGQTAKSPQELAEALFAVTSAGLRGNEAMTALELSAKASAAGLGTTKDISLTLAAAMTAYKAEGLSAAAATDILVATVREGNLEASDLAGSLGKILPVAQSAGVGLEEVGASIAIMTRSGLNAGEATTALRAALLSMNAPTAEASAALEDAGLSAEQLRTTLADDGVVAALEMVEQAADGDESAFRKLLGSTEALTGAQILLAQDSETLNATFDGVAGSAGSLADAFEAAKTPGFEMRQAVAESQVALISLGDTIAPFAATVARGLSTAASSFADLPPQIQTSVVVMGGLVAAVGPVMSVTGRLIENTGKLVDGFQNLRGRAQGLHAALGTGGLSASLLGVGTLVAAGAVLYQDYANTKAEAKRITETYVDAMQAENEALDANIDKVSAGELANKDYASAIREAEVGFDVFTDAVRNQADALESLDDDMRAFQQGAIELPEMLERAGISGTDLADALTLLQETMSAGDFSKLINDLDGLGDRHADAAVKTANQKAAADDLGGELDELSGSTAAAIDPTADLTQGLSDEEQQAEDLQAAIDAVTEATNELIGVHLTAESAALRVTGEFASLSEALKENGATLDINTETGRANREQLVSTTEAVLGHVKALGEEGATADEVNFVLQAHVGQLRETMRQAGLTESQIDDYIGTLGLTPDNIATLVQLNGVAAAERALSSLARVRVAQIHAQVTGARTAGLQLRHSGGHTDPSAGAVLIGRPGAEEMWVPDRPGHVVSGLNTDVLLGRTAGPTTSDRPGPGGLGGVHIDELHLHGQHDPAASARAVVLALRMA